MTQRNIAFLALVVSAIALVLSVLTYITQRSQYEVDYRERVIVDIEGWPHHLIEHNPTHELKFSLRNTSKSDVDYFIRVYGKGVCVQKQEKPKFWGGCDYESKIHTLSKPEAGAHVKEHRVFIDTLVDKSKLNTKASRSEPIFYINVDVLSLKTGKKLFSSRCYYEYNHEINQLEFHDPFIDTSGYDKILHSTCMRAARIKE